MACPLCNQRKGKRFCPAVNADICSICCGKEREVTLRCPFECPYLQQSRDRERKGLDPKDFPYKEIRIESAYLQENAQLLEACGRGVLAAALETPGAVDSDAREAMDAMIRTYRTLESGIYYETEPESGPARSVARKFKESLQAFQREAQRQGTVRIRDADVLKILVFLYRMALDRDNSRPKGRAYLHFLHQHFQPGSTQPGGIIVPGT